MSQTVSVTLESTVIYVSGTVNDTAVTWTNTEGNTWEAVAERSENDIYVIEITAINSAGTSATYSFTLYYGLLNLITDRTQADVSRVKTLAAKGWAGMTEDEQAEWLGSLKGSYDYTDLNRVTAAMDYLDARLDAFGYSSGYTPVKSGLWTVTDIPTGEQLEAYRQNVEKLRAVVNAYPETPESMAHLTYEGANDIEKILLTADGLITNMMAAWFYSNDVYSGEI